MEICIAIITDGTAYTEEPQVFTSVDACNKAYDKWFADNEIDNFYDPIQDTDDDCKTGYESGIDENGLKFCYVYDDGVIADEGSFVAYKKEI